MALAADIGEPQLEGLASMSLAASLSYEGDFARSIANVDRAIGLLRGDDLVAALSQKAGLLQRSGRHTDALLAFSRALAAAEPAGDETIIGDLLGNRGVLRAMTGDVAGAEKDTLRALELFEQRGWDKRAVDVRHNLAWLAGRRGDVVGALRRFDEATAGYEALGLTATSVFPDRCEVLISAGLAGEALDVAESAVKNFVQQGNQVDAAESLMLVARAALLAGDGQRAGEASDEAARSFELQGREGWDDAARVLSLDARLASGATTSSDRSDALAVASRLRSVGMSGHAATATLVAAEIAIESDDLDACNADLAELPTQHLGLVERFRRDLVTARLAVARDRPRDALTICAASLDSFIDISAALGGTEIRAHIAGHVERLVDIGASLALAAGDPTGVLQWAERQRSSVLTSAPVLPPQDAELERDFNLLRAVTTELDEIGRQGGDDTEARARFAAAQDRVRRRSRHLGDAVDGSTSRDDLVERVRRIDTSMHTWIVFVEAAGELHSIRAERADRAVTRLGTLDDVGRQVELLQSMYSMHLSALGRGRQRDPAPLLEAAAELDAVLFPVGRLGDERVVVCPTGSVFDLPWGLLPTLQSASFVLAPSIGSSHHHGDGNGNGDGDVDAPPSAVVSIAGPSLRFADDEAAAVAAIHSTEALLVGVAATADEAKRQMQASDLVHIVCHGRFVPGNAMFSSLLLHDGELFVHELERLRPAPAVVVLSACNAGLHGSPARGQVLGITTSLLAGGTRSVVAATVPVPDTVSTVALMITLHEHLRDGAGVADALRAVRAIDPVLGAAFSCHGHH